YNIALIASTVNIGGQLLSLGKSVVTILGRNAAVQAASLATAEDIFREDLLTASLTGQTTALGANIAAIQARNLALGIEAADLTAVATAETAVETAAFFGLVGL